MDEADMRIEARAFWLPKAGHSAAEYEDAFALSDGDALPYRAAVTDGATESAFARAWAERLACGFVADAPADAEALAASVARWQEEHAAAVAEQSRALPWYAAAKAEQGAFATFLGLTLARDGRWRALAVGDACLFHVRGEEERLRWPLGAPEQFGNRPALLGSRSEAEAPPPRADAQAGTHRSGDAFVLATDAVAAWLMRAGCHQALALEDAEAFCAAIEAARRNGTIRNDDATLVVLRLR